MFYLAHISDIHLPPLPQPSFFELLGKRLTGYINWEKKRKYQTRAEVLEAVMYALKKKKPHHLVISGDLINLALDQEFRQAQDWLFAQGSPKNISLTCGNHDAYVCGAFRKACTFFRPWIEGDVPQGNMNPFPYMRVRDNVAVIGASSAITTPPFQAFGYFGNTQAHALSQLLREAEIRNLFRIVIIHHPPFHRTTSWHKKLWGVKRFQHVIKNYGCELILHGHTHLPTLNILDGTTRKIPIVGVSSASQTFTGKNPPANFNWFSIDFCRNKWRCRLQRFGIINQKNDIVCTEEINLSDLTSSTF